MTIDFIWYAKQSMLWGTMVAHLFVVYIYQKVLSIIFTGSDPSSLLHGPPENISQERLNTS